MGSVKATEMSYLTGKPSETLPTLTNTWTIPPVQQVECLKEENSKSARKLVVEFARTTSGHGFARIVNPSEKILLRKFWAVSISSSLFVLLATTSVITYEALVIRQQRREFIIHHNTSMHLPDIHICDTALFKRSTLIGKTFFNFTVVRFILKHFENAKGLGLNDTMASYMALTLSALLTSNKLKTDITRRMELKRDLDKISNKMPIEQLFEKAALR